MCVNNCIWKNTTGIAFPMVTLFLGAIFLVGGLIVDSGKLYIRQAEIQNLANHSANNGLLEIEKVLQANAQSNKNSICSDPLNLPSICSSNNFWHFLSDSEITTLISSHSNRLVVKNAVKNFAVDFDPTQTIESADIQTHFPYDYQIGQKIKAKITLSANPEQFFSNLLTRTNDQISASAVRFLEVKR